MVLRQGQHFFCKGPDGKHVLGFDGLDLIIMNMNPCFPNHTANKYIWGIKHAISTLIDTVVNKKNNFLLQRVHK